jgi:Na+-translocating ferredoxin:NAD+ oxidoreductase RNF subunit RnfB
VILAAVAILGGVGLVFAILIALANRNLKVWEDPRIDVVSGMLPGANCGACGMPGCRAFAEKLVKGEFKPAGCNVATADARSDIASYLGVDAGTAVKTVARMMCAGGTGLSVQQAQIFNLRRSHSGCRRRQGLHVGMSRSRRLRQVMHVRRDAHAPRRHPHCRHRQVHGVR